MTDHLDLPISIVPGILYFIFAELLVHFIYCVIVWAIAQTATRRLNLSYNRRLLVSIAIWLVGVVFVLAANQYFLPNSKFTELTSLLLNDTLTKIILLVSAAILLTCFCLAMINSKLIKICFIILVALTGNIYLNNNSSVSTNVATKDKPNVIIIGVDSLRPDFLGYFGNDKPTPFFDSFLEQATSFSEAITPLARTFPSWTGILTGKYPRQIGIRTNLARHDEIDFSTTLPAILKKHGYETIYATDETRFSNIDSRYGFDNVISPPVGLNDFLLGTFNDFPLSNLLINTPIGRWLFPYSYANRPVYFAYQPDSFLRLVAPVLTEHRSKPLFLAIHFCLPHYPYLWASLSGKQYKPLARYEMSVIRVDQQLRDFFEQLKTAHLLDHAIVILLSDHGEALELSGDRVTESDLYLHQRKNQLMPLFYEPGVDKMSVDQSVGHGTDVLSIAQYHALLAFKLYGIKEQRSGVVPGLVSLLDIQPTILDLLSLSKNNALGHNNPNSLAPILFGKPVPFIDHRHIFLESDFSPEAIHTVYPETRKVLLEGIQLFHIDPQSTKLTVKDSMTKMIIKSKQYADIYNGWMLALYPQNDHYRMPILVNLSNGQWTTDMNSTFAKHSPVIAMLAALHTFYGDEIE